jgi:uncharacterized protein with ParB-like and HNH nuclease domain
MKGIQNTTTISYNELIGNKKYRIPYFQRDYSWSTEQWEDLWLDIDAVMKESDEHYMGYLVLQTSDNKEFQIIDGQQRITTVNLIILAAIKSIKKIAQKGEEVEENGQRIKNLTERYIGNADPVSLEYDNTLVLNKNNDDFYKDYIVKLDQLPVRNLSTTEKLMKKCFLYYEDKLNNRFNTGKEYAQFIIKMVDSLFFTVITVDNEMNAFRVFETLNARGVQLSSADLLKNYFFSIVASEKSHKSYISDLEKRWVKLISNIKAQKITDFLRYYWNSKNKIVRTPDLFKEIRNNIKTSEDVFLLILELIEYSDVYMALKDSNDDFWENDLEIKKYVGLLQIFNLKQPYSILMSAKKNLSLNDFKKVLKSVVIICFRYSVITGKNPNEIERSFNESARSISNDKTFDISKLSKIYVADNEFENAFSIKEFTVSSRNTKVVRYILGEINHFKDGTHKIDISDDNNSIEHILPQNPNEDWEVDEMKAEKLHLRLGNLCLLEKGYNKDLGNSNYDLKKEKYKESQFITTKSIPDHYEYWDENKINSRQRKMAEIAKSIWKVEELN